MRGTKDSNVAWTLTLIIPKDVFVYHQLASLHGQAGRANFYKCGDLLTDPHFTAWSNIRSPEPNFHLPEFFGAIQFS